MRASEPSRALVTRPLLWISLAVAAVLLLVGVDVLHTFAVVLCVVTGALISRAEKLWPYRRQPEPEHEPDVAPVVARHRLPSAAGDAAVGQGVGTSIGRAVAATLREHPDDARLRALADRYGADWRLLPRNELFSILDHLDRLDARAARPSATSAQKGAT